MEQEPEYLNAVQAAKYLGVNRQRIYVLANEGRLGRQIGGYWLFTLPELDAFKRERAKRPKGGRPRSRGRDATFTEPSASSDAELTPARGGMRGS